LIGYDVGIAFGVPAKSIFVFFGEPNANAQLVNVYLSVVAVQTFEKNVVDGVGYTLVSVAEAVYAILLVLYSVSV